jgi:hypothetical protein
MRKLNPIVVIISLVFFLSSALIAQEYKGRGRVVGRVFDETNQPLEGVKVKLFSQVAKQGFEVVTNGEGILIG